MAKSLRELEEDRKKLTRQIAAKKIKMGVKERISPENRKRIAKSANKAYSAFSRSMDHAARNMFPTRKV